MKIDDDSILIETYMAHVLSMGYDLRVDEVKRFAETLKGYKTCEESFQRRLRDRRNNLIKIGALKEGTKIHNNKSVNNESSFLKRDYTFDLKPFSFDKDAHLEKLYPVILLLNTCNHKERDKNINEVQTKYLHYYHNDNSKIIDNLYIALNIIEEMYKTFEMMEKDQETNKQLHLINRVFDKRRYRDIFECIASIKINPNFGYNPNEAEYTKVIDDNNDVYL